MSEERADSGGGKQTNPVAILGAISFLSAIASYLLYGLFFFISLFVSARLHQYNSISKTSILGAVTVLLSVVLALVGLVTGIVGTTTKRGEKLEGRRFAISGMVISGSYVLVLLIILVMCLLLAVFVSAAINTFMD